MSWNPNLSIAIPNTRGDPPAGIWVYLKARPGGEPVSGFAIAEIPPTRGADRVPRISARVTNAGGRALDISGTLNLSGQPGQHAGAPAPIAVTLVLAAGGVVVAALDATMPGGAWSVELASGTVEQQRDFAVTLARRGMSMVAKVVEN